MKDCFALRFNLQKSGRDIPDDTAVLSGLFGEDPQFLQDCLLEYDRLLEQAARELAAEFPGAGCIRKSLLLMGDSITSDRLSYGNILKRILKGPVVDCSVSHARSVNVAEKLDACITQHRPDILSVMIGTNDYVCLDKLSGQPAVSREEFARNLRIIAGKAQQYRVPLIFHAIPLACFDRYNRENPCRAAHESLCLAYNQTIRSVAMQYGAVYLDMSHLFQDLEKTLLFEPDGIHLSAFAHKLWARALLIQLITMDSGETYENY